MTTDLGREVRVETKPLQVDTEHLRKMHNAHLLDAVLETEKKEIKRLVTMIPRRCTCVLSSVLYSKH